MAVFMILLACLAAYYGLGVRLVARSHVTRQVAKHIADFPSLTKPHELERERRNAAGEGLFLAAFWPFVLVGRVLTGALASSAPAAPAEAELLLKQRADRIAELERELEIHP